MSHVIEFRGAMKPRRRIAVEVGDTPPLPGIAPADEAAEEKRTLSVRDRHDAAFDRPPAPSRIRLQSRWRGVVPAAFLLFALALASLFNHLKD